MAGVSAQRSGDVFLRHNAGVIQPYQKDSNNPQTGFLLTTTAWRVLAEFGAIAFLFADLRLDFADAFFESMSGLTTTGSTGLELDLDTAISGAVTAIANMGQGLGAIIGPAGNFAPLPDAAKWILSFTMLLGRLELFAVLVLYTPLFWWS